MAAACLACKVCPCTGVKVCSCWTAGAGGRKASKAAAIIASISSLLVAERRERETGPRASRARLRSPTRGGIAARVRPTMRRTPAALRLTGRGAAHDQARLLEQVFEEALDLLILDAAEDADGDLAPLNRLGAVAHDLFELLVGALRSVAAQRREQDELQLVVALRVVERDEHVEVLLLAAVRDRADGLLAQAHVRGAARDLDQLGARALVAPHAEGGDDVLPGLQVGRGVVEPEQLVHDVVAAPVCEHLDGVRARADGLGVDGHVAEYRGGARVVVVAERGECRVGRTLAVVHLAARAHALSRGLALALARRLQRDLAQRVEGALVVRAAERADGAHSQPQVRLGARHLDERGHGLRAAVATEQDDGRLLDARGVVVRAQHLADARRAVRLIVLAERAQRDDLQLVVAVFGHLDGRAGPELREHLDAQRLGVAGPGGAGELPEEAGVEVLVRGVFGDELVEGRGRLLPLLRVNQRPPVVERAQRGVAAARRRLDEAFEHLAVLRAGLRRGERYGERDRGEEGRDVEESRASVLSNVIHHGFSSFGSDAFAGV